MNDQELKVIIDVNKSLQSLNDTTQQLYKIIDNLVTTIHEGNTIGEITSLKIDEVKKQIEDTTNLTDEIKKKLEMLTLQIDFREMNNIKNKKLNDKLEKKLDRKKFSWGDFWDALKLFFQNSKWIFFILFIIGLIILIIFEVIKPIDAWNWIKKIFTPQVLSAD
jgi:hypothetical protein